MRTFEFKEGKSSKFWNINLNGRKFTVAFGRIGAKGQSQTKSFSNDAKAQAAHDKLVAEKLEKGYIETTVLSTSQILENAIMAAPDDVAARSAYADWLQEHDDPRGEFIQIQLALEDESLKTAKRKELQKREKVLLKKHQDEWLGRLGRSLAKNSKVYHPEDYGEVPNYHYRFARGFLDTLHITLLTPTFARALRDGSQARLLRELAIDDFTDDDEDHDATMTDIVNDEILAVNGPKVDNYRPLVPLLSIPCWDSLRSLRLGSEIDMDQCLHGNVTHHSYLQYYTPLFDHMPKLEELHLLGKFFDVKYLFSSKKLPNLRVLRIYHLGHRPGSDVHKNYEYPLATLAKNASFQNLTHLLFHPHHAESYHNPKALGRRGSFLPLSQVSTILHSPHLKQLRHLQLRLSNMGDAGCKEIVASGILKQLKVLDLRHGCITDEGANILAACRDLKNLEHLDICRNGLTAKGIKALKRTGISFAATHQQTPNELQNEQYLYEGDFE